jgi:two-component system, response regulator PdtaR
MRLVLADNDPEALDLIELDLRLEGHHVLAAVADGEQAVEACREHRPDVLVVDYRMPPGPNGVEVARRVLDDASVGRVVVYSNYHDAAVVRRAEALGALWLQKGDLDALRAAVVITLDERPAHEGSWSEG